MQFDWTITLGHVLTIILIAGSLVGAYLALRLRINETSGTAERAADCGDLRAGRATCDQSACRISVARSRAVPRDPPQVPDLKWCPH